MNPTTENMVCTMCFTYNQCSYIEDAMDGFVLQQTSFPVVYAIVDDASTDGEQDVIKSYIETKFDADSREEWSTEYADFLYATHRLNKMCRFLICFLRSNHYGNPELKAKKKEYISPWLTGAKYHALCEGDDYWIDPLKLQKQVDYLEEHEECSMCCSDCEIISGTRTLDWSRRSSDSDLNIDEIIRGGGGLIQTVTYVLKKGILEEYPDYCKRCYVGDFPLILWSSFMGKVHYLAQKTAVYRFSVPGSWTSDNKKLNFEEKSRNCSSMVNMLDGIDEYSNRKYHESIAWRKSYVVFGLMRSFKDRIPEIKVQFKDSVRSFSLVQRIDMFLFSAKLDSVHRVLSFLHGKIK